MWVSAALGGGVGDPRGMVGVRMRCGVPVRGRVRQRRLRLRRGALFRVTGIRVEVVRVVLPTAVVALLGAAGVRARVPDPVRVGRLGGWETPGQSEACAETRAGIESCATVRGSRLRRRVVSLWSGWRLRERGVRTGRYGQTW